MTKPVEFRRAVPGFGTWRIHYEPAQRRWRLAYNVRPQSEQWILAADFLVAESASQAVAAGKTGARIWDNLEFAKPEYSELLHWTTEKSEGVQPDAAE